MYQSYLIVVSVVRPREVVERLEGGLRELLEGVLRELLKRGMRKSLEMMGGQDRRSGGEENQRDKTRRGGGRPYKYVLPAT